MTREQMMNELVKRECRVIFRKANGEERNMVCTLQEAVIPASTKTDPIGQTKIRALNEEVIPVWDMQAAGWRSFRTDSVISFS